jgi:hypothetical protein
MGIAFRLWLYYVALEPYARRFWPDLLISWSRLLKARLHDPLVGRDLQIGCFAGVLLVLFTSWPATILHRIDANTFTSGRIAVAEVLESHQSSLTFSFFLLAFLLILRVVLRNTWLAGIVFTIAYVLFAIRRDSIWELYLSNAVWASLLVCLYVRYGLVSVVAGWFTVLVLLRFPFTADFSAWYAHGGMLALASVLLVTGYGFYISTLAGRRVPTPEL